MNFQQSFRHVSSATGIGAEEYANMMLDLGCAYAASSVGAERYEEVIGSREFWSWYVTEWIELDESFILDVHCQSKKFRENHAHNLANYRHLKQTTLPRLDGKMAVLLCKPSEIRFGRVISKRLCKISNKRTKTVNNGG